MFNVDTLSLTMTFRRYIKIRKLDWNYIYKVQSKIMKKLVLYERDKQNREKEIRYSRLSNENRIVIDRILKNRKRRILPIYWHGKYDGYVFTYNENWQSLTIMLPNNKVEKYTADEIKSDVRKVIIEYFNLEPAELNELVLNRIDVHCDYKFDNEVQYLIIKNIIKKAPDRFYNYKKRLIKDDKDGYLLKYIALRKNKNIEDILTLEEKNLEVESEVEEYENNE